MAGVYIKGMKTPEKCEDCRFWDGYNNGCTVVHMITLRRMHQKKPDWCPLVEVLDCGDLIDRETIVDSVCNGVCSCSECSFNQYPSDSCVLQTNLEKLKVVIPANKEGV